MKDQFANYVVQKVLETCDDQQRELILSRIKVHLNALKKYTYGKHIVARVEKLVAAGGTYPFPHNLLWPVYLLITDAYLLITECIYEKENMPLQLHFPVYILHSF